MSPNYFQEEDKEKFIEFLNMVSKHSKFEMSTTDLIKYFHLLSHMQKVVLPKLDANILEIRRVVEAEKKEG